MVAKSRPTSVASILLLATLTGRSSVAQAQPVPLDPLSVFVVLKCLSVSWDQARRRSGSCLAAVHYDTVVHLQGTFLSYALNGVPLDPASAGTSDVGPANGAGPASLSPETRSILSILLAEDATQLG